MAKSAPSPGNKLEAEAEDDWGSSVTSVAWVGVSPEAQPSSCQVTPIREADVPCGATNLWRAGEATIKSELPFPSRKTEK